MPDTPAPSLAELVAEIRERWGRASQQPGAWGIYDPARDAVEWFRENLSHGDGPVHVVWLPTHPLVVGEHPRPDHAVLMCITGNGPTSEANAQAIAHAREDVDALLSAIARLEAERAEILARLTRMEKGEG